MKKWCCAVAMTSISLVSFSARADISFAKAQDFLKKKDICYFAVGLSNPNAPTSLTPDVAEDILCVTDRSSGSGEDPGKPGCSLMILNTESGQLRKATFSAMMNPRTVDLAIVKDILCAQGGFEKLLETKFTSFYGEGPKIKKILYSGPQGLGARTSILLAKSETARKSYEAAAAKITEETKAAEAIAAEKTRVAEAKTRADKIAQVAHQEKHLASIEGTWIQPCLPLPEGGMNVMRERTYIGGRYTIVTKWHEDTDVVCKRRPVYVMKATGTYQVSKSIEDRSAVKEIDLVPLKVTAMPKNQQIANELTAKSSSGIMVWQVGEEHDISSSVPLTKIYTVYKIEGRTLFLSSDPNRTESRNRKSLKFGDDSKWFRAGEQAEEEE